jgi:hypothetical protein
MARAKKKIQPKTFAQKYPPSPACACELCVRFCARPGWWTVEEATRAMSGGYTGRMMLEMAPDRSFGVLSPAFKGNEGKLALNLFASRGCGFLVANRCELFGSGAQPLECRFCHHDRPGQGPRCHADLEKDWNTAPGRKLVARWLKESGLWERQLLFGG